MRIQHGATHLLNNHMGEPIQVRIVDGKIFTAGGFGSWTFYRNLVDADCILSELIELHPKYAEGYEDE